NGKLGEKDDAIDDGTIAKDSVDVVWNAEGAESKRHASLVTKTIAADKNSETIRGVAEPFAHIRFTGMGNISQDEVQESIAEAEIISQIKKSIQEDDVKVINNSWGFPPM